MMFISSSLPFVLSVNELSVLTLCCHRLLFIINLIRILEYSVTILEN